MARFITHTARARGKLAIDPKSEDAPLSAERLTAWDEDATTLVIEAAATLPRAPLAFVAPSVDAETVRVALDVATVFTSSDPLTMARQAQGAALALTTPDASSGIATIVDVSAGPDAPPRDVSPHPRLVSALRALQESRVVPPPEPMPDSPMGAYVPWGTWTEDLPARLRLLAQRCKECARVMYPPRGACPVCRGRAFEDFALPSEAQVYAATRIGRGGAPSEFALEQAAVGAYWMGVVDWPEHEVRVTARLADFDEQGPAIGQKVVPVVRRLFSQEGRVRYGVKFGPKA